LETPDLLLGDDRLLKFGRGGPGFFDAKAQDVLVQKVRELAQKAGRKVRESLGRGTGLRWRAGFAWIILSSRLAPSNVAGRIV